MPLLNPRYRENLVENTPPDGKTNEYPDKFSQDPLDALPDFVEDKSFFDTVSEPFENFTNDFAFSQINEYPETLGNTLGNRGSEAQDGDKLSTEELADAYADLPRELWTEPKTRASADLIALNYRTTEEIAKQYPPRADGTRGIIASTLGGMSGHLDIKNPANIIVGVASGFAVAATATALAPAALGALALGGIIAGIDSLVYTSIEFLSRHQYQKQSGLDSTNSAQRFFQESVVGALLALPSLLKFAKKPKLKVGKEQKLPNPGKKQQTPGVEKPSDIPIELAEEIYKNLNKRRPDALPTKGAELLSKLQKKLFRMKKRLLMPEDKTLKFTEKQAEIKVLIEKLYTDFEAPKQVADTASKGKNIFNEGKALSKKQELDKLSDLLDTYYHSVDLNETAVAKEVELDVKASKQFVDGEVIDVEIEPNLAADEVKTVVKSHDKNTVDIDPESYGEDFSTPVKGDDQATLAYDDFQRRKNELKEFVESDAGETLNKNADKTRTKEQLDELEVKTEDKIDSSIDERLAELKDDTLSKENIAAKKELEDSYKKLKNVDSLLDYIKCRLGK